VRVYHHADLRSFKPQVKLPGELPSDQRLRGFGGLGYRSGASQDSGQEGQAVQVPFCRGSTKVYSRTHQQTPNRSVLRSPARGGKVTGRC